MLQALLAAMLGTVAMTLSSATEMDWRDRPPSTAPGRAVLEILRRLGMSFKLEDRGLRILSTWVHWAYGTGWGVLLWLLIARELPVFATGLAFFLIVWGAEQVHLPLLGVAPPSWRWGLRENLIDAWHHLVHAAGTLGAWSLLGLL